jgi:hypothetical protein
MKMRKIHKKIYDFIIEISLTMHNTMSGTDWMFEYWIWTYLRIITFKTFFNILYNFSRKNEWPNIFVSIFYRWIELKNSQQDKKNQLNVIIFEFAHIWKNMKLKIFFDILHNFSNKNEKPKYHYFHFLLVN